MKKGNLKETKGITLIALVVTIVVLLILAGVSIAMLSGEDGIINQAQKAKVENSHATVKEAIEIKYSEYQLEKRTGGTTQTLIEYFKDEEQIIKETAEEGKYLIDVEKLVGSKQALGNGTETDVYMLEEVTEGTGKLGEIATTKPIKLADATTTEKEYKVMYYGETASENRVLDILKDDVISKPELITFYVNPNIYIPGMPDWNEDEYVSCSAYKGWTWEEWISSEFNTMEIYIGDIHVQMQEGAVVLDGAACHNDDGEYVHRNRFYR